jgi:hypothetical protein
MTSILFVAFLFLVWSLAIPVSVWHRAAKGDFGGTSILPTIPICPLVAWGIAAALNLFGDGMGFTLVGGAHALLLVVFLASAAKSLYTLRKSGYFKQA